MCKSSVPTYTSTDATVNWFERYGRKKGFICYILRYFLLLNWRQNLQVIKDEFLALVAMVMGCLDEKKYQAIVIRPTVRCVTIGNWMQDVYRHGYNMFGSVLYIRKEFPKPSELFSGAVWTAMYMACQDDTFQDAFRGVSLEVLKQIKEEKSSVIRENNGVSSGVLDRTKKEMSTAKRENTEVLSEVLDMIKKEKNTVIDDNRDMIIGIVHGVFPLYDEKL
ncbi:hypothetical protein MAR_003951 [Mya arenaria]|uniref:Uncharacterized protein n=1 Tax=Mya arenaria TaxID=6604 RepID=A0ABY7EYD6_MYAAR|nr:hypothetical protein MAR_003951 [Mya arenaria]